MNPVVVLALALGAVILIALRKGLPSPKSFAGPPAPAPGPDKVPEPAGPPAPAAPGWTNSDLLILAGEIANEERVSPALVKAIVSVESSWDPRAINRGDRPPSVGLMGLKVPTARAYVPWVESEVDLYDPPTNLRAGARFLKDLTNKWSSSYGLDGVIQMYNLGEPRFLDGERSPDYLARVRANLA